MKRFPVLAFVFLACLISWLGWLPSLLASRGVQAFSHPAFQLATLLAGLGPTLAAVVVSLAIEGRQGVRRLFAGLAGLRVNPLWYVAALMGPLVVFALAGLIESLRADHGLALRAQPFVVLIGSFLTNLVLNVWEEIGWRGFALRRVLSHVLLLPASLIVGLAWGIWHVPLFLMPGSAFSNAPFLVWIIGLIALSVLYAALYTGSKQSLFLVTLFHAGINTVGGLLYTGTYVSATLASVLLAVVVLVVTWHKWGRRPRGLDPAAGRQTASAPGSPLR